MPRPKQEDTDTQEATDSKIRFFGEVDLDRDGKITSDMPAWYFERHIDEMEEGILRKENQLARGAIAADNVPMIKEEIKAEKAKLRKIKESKPTLTGNQVDRCWRVYKSLTEQIQASMPTRKQSKDGLVNPYDELKRLKQKHIKIDPEIAKACGVKAVQGKISGDEANKCYQIIGRTLGENTNVEALRRDGNTEAYHTINDLTKAILSGMQIKGA